MLPFARAAALCSLLVLAAACGGPEEEAGDALGQTEDALTQTAGTLAGFDPFTQVSAAKKAATVYARSPALTGVHGERSGLVGGAPSYKWTLSFLGQDGVTVVVAVGPKMSAKVTVHERRMTFVGVGTFDPAAIKIHPGALPALLAQAHKSGAIQALDLTSPLVQHPQPHWTVDLGTQAAFVDAATGRVQ